MKKLWKIQVENLAFSGSSARYESKWNQKRSGAWSTGPGLLFLTPLEKTRLGMRHAMVRELNFDEHLSGALRRCAPLNFSLHFSPFFRINAVTYTITQPRVHQHLREAAGCRASWSHCCCVSLCFHSIKTSTQWNNCRRLASPFDPFSDPRG